MGVTVALTLAALAFLAARRAYFWTKAVLTMQRVDAIQNAYHSYNMWNPSAEWPKLDDLSKELNAFHLKVDSEGRPIDYYGNPMTLPKGDGEYVVLSPETYEKIRNLVPVPRENAPPSVQ